MGLEGKSRTKKRCWLKSTQQLPPGIDTWLDLACMTYRARQAHLAMDHADVAKATGDAPYFMAKFRWKSQERVESVIHDCGWYGIGGPRPLREIVSNG